MKTVLNVLFKVLVREFYLANAGFFLVVIGLAAGFMRSYEHIALAEFFISSPVFFLIPLCVWLLYCAQVLQFNLSTLKRKENEFLFNVIFLPRGQLLLVLARTLYMQLIPMHFYAAFLILIAWKNSALSTLMMAVIFPPVLVLAATTLLDHTIRYPHIQRNVSILARFINTKFTKMYPLFFPEWIMRRQPLLVIGTKVFSGSILLGVTALYGTDVYDIRLLAMGLVVAFSANIPLVWEIHRYDNFHLRLIRNLPIRYINRLVFFLATLMILTIPEAGVIIKNFPAALNTFEIVPVMLFGWSIPILFYGCLYIKDLRQEQLTSIVFFSGIFMIILILFKFSIGLLAAVNLTVGSFCWNRYYYSFEYRSKDEN